MFSIIFYFYSYLGRWSNLTNTFLNGLFQPPTRFWSSCWLLRTPLLRWLGCHFLLLEAKVYLLHFTRPGVFPMTRPAVQFLLVVSTRSHLILTGFLEMLWLHNNFTTMICCCLIFVCNHSTQCLETFTSKRKRLEPENTSSTKPSWLWVPAASFQGCKTPFSWYGNHAGSPGDGLVFWRACCLQLSLVKNYLGWLEFKSREVYCT